MKYLIPPLALPVMYLLGAFVNWNLDAGTWPEMSRFIVATIGAFFTLVGWQVILELKK